MGRMDTFGTTSAYTHNGDKSLMESLGLQTWGFNRAHTPLGRVVLHQADEHNPHPTTIDVEVVAMPAQFWRFTISRPIDVGINENGYGEAETLVVETGSGGFTTFWDAVKLIADEMLTIRKCETAQPQKEEETHPLTGREP